MGGVSQFLLKTFSPGNEEKKLPFVTLYFVPLNLVTVSYAPVP